MTRPYRRRFLAHLHRRALAAVHRRAVYGPPGRVVHLHPEAPAFGWPALRPRGDEPCVLGWYDTPGKVTPTLHHLHAVRDGKQARDPAWWRDRLGMGVPFTLVLHARGMDRPGQRIGSWSCSDQPPPRVEEMPDVVVVRTPDGDVRATYAGEGDEGHAYVADRFGWVGVVRAAGERMGWVARRVADKVVRLGSERRRRSVTVAEPRRLDTSGDR